MSDRQTRATLLAWLQTALELELATIPPYLVALLSIKLPMNREAAELIRSVMVEEMLHVALVANVLNSVGGTPRLDSRAIPSYPLQMTFEGEPFTDRKFPINLAPFSADAISTFLKIEQPQQLVRDAALLQKEIEVPGLTIGAFYCKILNLIEVLSAQDGAALFCGERAHQIDQDYYWSGGGKIIAVHDLTTAQAALDLVIAQGEAAWPREKGPASTGFGVALQMGHYYRFNEIARARHYLPSDDPALPPTGAPMSVDYAAVYPIKTNPKTSDFGRHSQLESLNELFNMRYTTMLMELQETFSGTPKTLYTAIMDSMHELTPIAHDMMKIPIDHSDGLTGCPTFEWVEGRSR
jgi:hypothetical protein